MPYLLSIERTGLEVPGWRQHLVTIWMVGEIDGGGIRRGYPSCVHKGLPLADERHLNILV